MASFNEELAVCTRKAAALRVDCESDTESNSSSPSASTCVPSSASSTVGSPLSPLLDAQCAIDVPTAAQALLSLQVHTPADLSGLARALCELAYVPIHTEACAELIERIMPYMVTAFVEGRKRTILDEVVRICQESLATVHTECPAESVYGAVLLLSHLFNRRMVPLAVIRDLFMYLLFVEDDELPPAHALNLACHVMVACSVSIKQYPNGATMIDYLILRLKELKGRNYPADTTQAITAAVDFEVRQVRELKEAEERAASASRKAQAVIRKPYWKNHRNYAVRS